MFTYVFQYFSLDEHWKILATLGPSYQFEASSTSTSSTTLQAAKETLQTIRLAIDLIHSFSSTATKGFAYFTAINILCYHFTGWISGVSLIYGITSVVFGWISYEFLQLTIGMLQLKETFTLMLGANTEPTHYVREEIQAFSEENQKQHLRNYRRGIAVLRPEQQSSYNIHDERLRVHLTLIHIQNAIRQMEHLRRSLPLLNYYALPFKTPLRNLSTHLRQIETHLKKTALQD